MKLVQNPVLHVRTKHREICHHYIKEKVKDSTVEINYIPMHKQIANLLTKPLGRIHFDFF